MALVPPHADHDTLTRDELESYWLRLLLMMRAPLRALRDWVKRRGVDEELLDYDSDLPVEWTAEILPRLAKRKFRLDRDSPHNPARAKKSKRV